MCSFFGRRIFCTQSAILRQWVSESDSPVQRSVVWGGGEEQEKLTFVILKRWSDRRDRVNKWESAVVRLID